MKAIRNKNWYGVLISILMLVIPAVVLEGLVLTSLFQLGGLDQHVSISLYVFLFVVLSLSVLFYSYPFKLFSTAGLLLIIFYAVIKLSDNFYFGEFDGFYIKSKLLFLAWMMLWNWLLGYALKRSLSILSIQLALLLTLLVYAKSQMPFVDAFSLLSSAIPGIILALWLLVASRFVEQTEKESSIKPFILKSLLFLLLLFLLMLGVLNWFKGNITVVEREWAQGKAQGNGHEGERDKESMTKKNQNGGIENKDQTKLTGSLKRDKELVFVAKLDNYFEDGTPNPLYFTSHYYTNFDEETQTFEPDPNMPLNDLFQPDVSQIPLYKVRKDSNVIRQSLGLLNRKVISTEVYKVAMASNAFVAPSTAFLCQPISPPDNVLYKSAYKAKMWVSELNSAYFIYNPSNNMELEMFQQQRFDILRTCDKLELPNKKDQSYYTKMPIDPEYQSIYKLTDSITKDLTHPIDKIIAIRDYFTSKNSYGQPLFRYSDNPGIPGLPSASKLKYFLFENRKGYCAYFAGATLFMLRSIGIPSRIAVGYLTVDRSNKNPGWYWFYQDQAHAWVQVFFPGFGWIDFDTTVPDQNTREAEQPDGTPPEENSQIYLVTHGVIRKIDTNARTVDLKTNQIIYHDREYKQADSVVIKLDLNNARLLMDTGLIHINQIKIGMLGTAVSRDISLKDKNPAEFSLKSLITLLSNPLPIDELKLMSLKNNRDSKSEKRKVDSSLNWSIIFKGIIVVCLLIGLILLALPSFLYFYFKHKAKSRKIEEVYRWYLFRLHQLGVKPQSETILQFAKRVDGVLNISFFSVSEFYLKRLFNPLDSQQFYSGELDFKRMNHQFSKHYNRKERMASWFNFSRAIKFLKSLYK